MILDTEELVKQNNPEKRFWFDTETTGTDTKLCAIHELACIVEIDGIIREKKVWNIKPFEGCLVESGALEVSGVTREQIDSYQTELEAYEQIIKFLSKYVSKWDKKDKFKMYGYNVHFDMEMLIEFFKRNNDKFFFTWFWSGPIDVMSKAAELFANVRPIMKDFKLITIIKELEINCLDKFHGALFDIEMTREAYYKIDKLQKLRAYQELVIEINPYKEGILKELKLTIKEDTNPLSPDKFIDSMNKFDETELPKVQTLKEDKNEISDYNYKFTFGKYKSKTLREVLDTNANYVLWCHDNNIQNLKFSESIIEEATELEEVQKAEFKQQQKENWKRTNGYSANIYSKKEEYSESPDIDSWDNEPLF